jgi:hypothetical protein
MWYQTSTLHNLDCPLTGFGQTGAVVLFLHGEVAERAIALRPHH